jgi:hypothetical protein
MMFARKLAQLFDTSIAECHSLRLALPLALWTPSSMPQIVRRYVKNMLIEAPNAYFSLCGNISTGEKYTASFVRNLSDFRGICFA